MCAHARKYAHIVQVFNKNSVYLNVFFLAEKQPKNPKLQFLLFGIFISTNLQKVK